MQYGKIFTSNIPRKCLVKPETQEKWVVVYERPSWVSKGDKIPFKLKVDMIAQRQYEGTNLGTFVNRYENGSVILIGHSPSDYVRDSKLPKGVFFVVMGRGTLFDLVEQTLVNADYTYGKINYFTNIKDHSRFQYFLGHQSNPDFLTSNLEELMKKYEVFKGSEFKDNYFISMNPIKTDEKSINIDWILKTKFTDKARELYKALLLR